MSPPLPAQGALERERGLPTTPMCKPVHTPAKPQLAFIRAFLEPTLIACKPLVPGFVAMALSGMKRSEDAWEVVLARENLATQCKAEQALSTQP
jgi:hypothetical protein